MHSDLWCEKCGRITRHVFTAEARGWVCGECGNLAQRVAGRSNAPVAEPEHETPKTPDVVGPKPPEPESAMTTENSSWVPKLKKPKQSRARKR